MPRATEVTALRRRYGDETCALLHRRLCMFFILFVGLMGMIVLTETRLDPARTRPALAIYAVEIGLCAGAVVASRRPGLRRQASTIGFGLIIALLALVSTYAAIVHLRPERLALAHAALMTGQVLVLQWDWKRQLLVPLASMATFALAFPYLSSIEAPIDAMVVLLDGAGIAMAGAYFLDRYRYDAFVRTVMLEEEADVTATLVRFSETLNAHLHRPDLLARVNGLLVETLAVQWSSVFFWHDDGVARLAAAAGPRPDLLTQMTQIPLPLDAMPIFAAVRRNELIEIHQPDAQTLVPPDLLRRLDVGSLLIAPITRNDVVVGMIVAGYQERGRPFSVRQRRLVQGVAHAIAVALENTRLIADLKAANRLKSEFVATMSHELRTPLSIICGYSDLLIEGAFGRLESPQHDTLQRIRRSALELLDLINATLDLGRLDAGREPLTTSSFAVAALFDELAAELEPMLAPGVVLHWQDGLGEATIHTDRTKLKTIVKNLVANALKFTSAGSVEVQATAAADALRFAVRDTGIGIAPQDQTMIFDMFRQADSSSTRRFGGVGLGLHIVKRLSELLGGTVTVQSAPGDGSTFTVALPASVLEMPERLTASA